MLEIKERGGGGGTVMFLFIYVCVYVCLMWAWMVYVCCVLVSPTTFVFTRGVYLPRKFCMPLSSCGLAASLLVSRHAVGDTVYV